jgi:acyl CoA:acetate/3-ketoacid CoA transferase
LTMLKIPEAWEYVPEFCVFFVGGLWKVVGHQAKHRLNDSMITCTMNSESQKIQSYKILHMLENAPGQPLVTEIYTHKIITTSWRAISAHRWHVIATVHLNTFAKPMIKGGKQKLLQHLVQKIFNYIQNTAKT